MTSYEHYGGMAYVSRLLLELYQLMLEMPQ